MKSFFSDIVELPSDAGSLIRTGSIRELGEWIEAMPEMVVWQNPWLIFYLTMTRRIKGGSRNDEDFRIALDLFRQRHDVPKEMIVEDIWLGSSVKAGEENCKINLHKLRKALEDDLEENAGFSYIHRTFRTPKNNSSVIFWGAESASQTG